MSSEHHNNFDFLRLLAALGVWYGHCYVLTGRPDPWPATHPYLAPSQLGVAVFFIISGYFVTASYINRGSFTVFLKNRALRILPALITVILLSALVLGPMVTSLSPGRYFATYETWNYLKSMLIFPLHYTLPGVFADTPVSAVNGSLWTLKQEVRCYGAIALMGVLGILTPRFIVVLIGAMCGLLLYYAFNGHPPSRLLGMNWGDLHILFELATLFAAGAFLFLAGEKLVLNFKGALLAAIIGAMAILLPLEYGVMLFHLCLAYLVVYVGFAAIPGLRLLRTPDMSYGLYLYAFPMQQLTIHLWGTAHFHRFMAISLGLSIICAFLSWRFVERPALAYKTAA